MQYKNKIKSYFSSKVISQDHAIEILSAYAAQSRFGLARPGQLQGSFLFLGPTGVGKTYLSLLLSRFMYQSDCHRFDMSEFMDKSSLPRLLGSEANIGLLEKYHDQNDRGVFLFDEMEKAAPEILDLMLQLLDAARVTTHEGRVLDFSGWFVILTSNLGVRESMDAVYSSPSAIEKAVLENAQQQLRPEFWYRISEQIVFNRLDSESQIRIADLLIAGEIAHLKDRGIQLSVTDAARKWLIRHGVTPRAGMRPMRQLIERELRNCAVELLENNLSSGTVVPDGKRLANASPTLAPLLLPVES